MCSACQLLEFTVDGINGHLRKTMVIRSCGGEGGGRVQRKERLTRQIGAADIMLVNPTVFLPTLPLIRMMVFAYRILALIGYC